MYKVISSKCWTCKVKEGTFYHMWWTCDVARVYWKVIYEWWQKVLDTNLAFTPEVFLLTMLLQYSNRKEKHLIVNVVTAARILWAKYWKVEKTSSKQELIKTFLETAEIDILTTIIKNKDDQKNKRHLGTII